MGSETRDPNKKKLLGVVVLAVILLTSSWFIGVPENKIDKIANSSARISLNPRQNTYVNFINDQPQSVFVEPQIESDRQSKLLAPVNWTGIQPLLDSLKGFGEKFTAPADVLSKDPSFVSQDLDIVRRTKKVYGNPSHFVLGEQCGLEGPVFAYPPGRNDFTTACGGTPAFSGIPSTTLNTLTDAIGDILSETTNLDLTTIQTISSALSGNVSEALGGLLSQGLSQSGIVDQLNNIIGNQLGDALTNSGLPQAIIGSITSQVIGNVGDILGGIVGNALGGIFGSGGSCNTDSACMFSGRCFRVIIRHRLFCVVQSCYGACGNSTYIWDSVTGTCGCGNGGGIGFSFDSIGSGLLSGLGSNLWGGLSSGILNSLGSSVLSGLGSSILSNLGSGILSGLGTNLASELSSGLLNGISSSLLGNLTTNALQQALGGTLGSSILQQLGTTAIQSLGSQLGVNLSQGLSSQITGVIQQVVTSGDLSGLSSGQLISLGQKIGQTILQNTGANGVSGASRQIGSGLAQQLGTQNLTQLLNQAVQTTNP